jgi:hypothetical protein
MSTISQILFRRGTDQSRQNTLLGPGEPGFTTDSKRLFVGDGNTNGGYIAGNVNYGAFTTVVGGTNFNSSGLDTLAYFALTGAQIGDIIYDQSTNTVYAVSATPNGTPSVSQLYALANNVTLCASEFYFGPQAQLSIANQAISAFHVSPAALDNTTIAFDSNNVIAAALGSTDPGTTGIANENLQWAPANSVKGNFTSTLSTITDQVFLTGTNVYQFLGTASNTGLGVVGLSAGQNVSFTTLTAQQSNGQILNTVLVQSTPNLAAGDGLVYNTNPNTSEYTMSVANSLQWIRSTDMYLGYSGAATRVITPGDGTRLTTVYFPYNNNTNSYGLSAIPTVSFDTIAPTNNPPNLTIYWTTTANGGSDVTVFASNSAVALYYSNNVNGAVPVEVGRGPLFPSYWQQYSYVSRAGYSIYHRGDSRGKDPGWNEWVPPVYATAWADYQASITCMMLSGNKLWIGGNFQNIGDTAAPGGGNVRYGIAVINLSGGGAWPTNLALGNVGSLTTVGNAILDSSGRNYGITQLSPGHTVNQMVMFGTYLCVGGNWAAQVSDGAQWTSTKENAPGITVTQPSISLALFNTTNGYAISGYQFYTAGDAPATITSLVSGGDGFLYVAGNFYKCSRFTGDTGFSYTPGITRIKLVQNTNTGYAIDNQVVGSIDVDFNSVITREFGNLTNPQVIYKNPVTCLCLVPNVTGGYILWAGGSHTISSGNNTYRYKNLTTHWIGNSSQAPDGTLTQFNCVFNNPVNAITYDTVYPSGIVYVGGDFTNYTSSRVRGSYDVNFCVAFDTIGFMIGNQNTNNGFGYTDTYTSPDNPLIINQWFPQLDNTVTAIEIHDDAPFTPSTLSAVYLAGTFTRVGNTKAPYVAAVPIPNNAFYIGTIPSVWTPFPNTALRHTTFKGGKGVHLLRIPYTNPLSGVLIAGNDTFKSINGTVRPSWGRVTGVGESIVTSPSAVTWCIAAQVLGQHNFINIDTTRVVSLSDPAGAAYTVNATRFLANYLPSLYNVRRGDLCRFIVYRPGAFSSKFRSPVDTLVDGSQNGAGVDVLGVKLDWDTGTAMNRYPILNIGTYYSPMSTISTASSALA